MRLSPQWGARIYAGVERIAPAPFVESMLAEYALKTGDVDGAQRHAQRLPLSAARNELLGRIWEARGERALALEYYLVAPDVDAVQANVEAMAANDPFAAYALEERFKDRLQEMTTHPDAVAEAYWHLGMLATTEAYRYQDRTHRMLYFREGLRNYRHAADLAPLSERYLLATASEALNVGDLPVARQYYERGIDVDPTSADAFAGLGLVALQTGDVTTARRYAAHARALDPSAPFLLRLQSALASHS